MNICSNFRSFTVVLQMISCLALMTQSYLVTERENKKLNSGTEAFENLIRLLECSMNKTHYNGLSAVPIEILQVKISLNLMILMVLSCNYADYNCYHLDK